MKKQRLLKLVKLLREDARNKKGVSFDITVWAAPTGQRLFPGVPTTPLPVSCGTSACAMGLAVISGVFKKQGLNATYNLHHDGVSMEPIIALDGNTFLGYHAAAKLFGISPIEAVFLFSPTYYSDQHASVDDPGQMRGAEGERRVANRIAKFVRDGGVFRSNGERPTYEGELRDCY